MTAKSVPAILSIFKPEDETEDFAAGQTIFEQGQMGDVMYCILKGEIQIVFNDQVINTHGAGEIFGELALIDTQIRSASAIAKTDCQLIPVNERRFIFLTQQHPFFALHVMRILAQRLRKWTES
ncbi:MAG: cyclic nucleotide-binding domain-containing protein [Microcystaceae cyanobacterium]